MADLDHYTSSSLHSIFFWILITNICLFIFLAIIFGRGQTHLQEIEGLEVQDRVRDTRVAEWMRRAKEIRAFQVPAPVLHKILVNRDVRHQVSESSRYGTVDIGDQGEAPSAGSNSILQQHVRWKGYGSTNVPE